jgi:hypothetical protein
MQHIFYPSPKLANDLGRHEYFVFGIAQELDYPSICARPFTDLADDVGVDEKQHQPRSRSKSESSPTLGMESNTSFKERFLG